MFKRLFSGTDSQGRSAQNAPPANQPAPDTLRRLQALSHLSHDELILLANKLEMHEFEAGACLFQSGDDDDTDYFLIKGRVQINAIDGGERIISGGTEKAQTVLCALRPRQFTAVALLDSTCLAIDREVLANIMVSAPDNTGAASPPDSNQDMKTGEESLPDPTEALDSIAVAQLEASFNDDLQQNRFVVTSLPEIAIKVRKVLENPDFTAENIAAVINTDPAIAAKLLKASNSPLYRSWEPCETTSEAVVRLGVKTTRQLVMSFTLKDLFRAETVALKRAMHDAWRHTVYHAAIAWVMARETGLYSAEEAMTAAMLSNVGVLTVCAYLESYPDVQQNPDSIAATVAHLKARVSGQILSKWGLSDQLIECGRHADNWSRDHEGSPDLCDLIIVAGLHAYIGRRRVPRIDQVPAFQRLYNAGLLDPDTALDFLKSAAEQVAQARALLQ
jgi:HD-like signal output (HDOD) protein